MLVKRRRRNQSGDLFPTGFLFCFHNMVIRWIMVLAPLGFEPLDRKNFSSFLSREWHQKVSKK